MSVQLDRMQATVRRIDGALGELEHDARLNRLPAAVMSRIQRAESDMAACHQLLDVANGTVPDRRSTARR